MGSLIINGILSKVSAILFLLAMAVVFFKPELTKGKFKEGKTMHKIAVFIDKRHVILGKLALLLSLVHGIVSPVKVLSANWGTYCFAIIVLSCIPCAFHKEGKKDLGLILHKILSIFAFVAFVLHIVLESL